MTVNFLAIADTSSAPNGQTINVATGQGGQVDPDGPGGPLGPLQTVGVKSANAPVQIFSRFLLTKPMSAALQAPQLRLPLRLLRRSHERSLIIQYFSKPGSDSGLFFFRV